MKPKDHSGLTLLELLVVLILISVLTGLLAPRVGNSVRNMTLKAAAQKVAASLRYARSRAISEKITYVALFDFERSNLSVFTEPGPTKTTKEKPSTGGEEKTSHPKAYVLPEGVRLTKARFGTDEVQSGLFRMLFSPNGSSSGGWVILGNDAGTRYRIGVDILTGAVRFGDPDRN
jgi:general secretion pathway protein H